MTLPRDPDASARALRAALPHRPAVVITDSFGRAWRHGQCDVAIGIAGLARARRLARAPRPARAASCALLRSPSPTRPRRPPTWCATRRRGEPAVVVRGLGAPRHRRRRSWRGGAPAARRPRTCSSDDASVSRARRPGNGSPHESFQNTPRRRRRRGPHRRRRCGRQRDGRQRWHQRIPRRLQAGRRPGRRPPGGRRRRRQDRLREPGHRRRDRAHRRRRLPAEGRRAGRARGRGRQRGHRPGPDDSAKVRRDAIEKPAFAYKRTAKADQEAQGRLPPPASRWPTSSGTCA